MIRWATFCPIPGTLVSVLTSSPATATWRDQVHQGLTGLGWPAREADRAVESVADQAGDSPDIGALLRLALQTLSRA